MFCSTNNDQQIAQETFSIQVSCEWKTILFFYFFFLLLLLISEVALNWSKVTKTFTLIQKNMLQINDVLLFFYSSHNVSWAQDKSIGIISERSCDTEGWNFSFAITKINKTHIYIWLYSGCSFQVCVKVCHAVSCPTPIILSSGQEASDPKLWVKTLHPKKWTRSPNACCLPAC